jgi:hypothetical protein
MLRYQKGCVGAPALEATTAWVPLSSILIRGVLRILPELAPLQVSTMTGLPFSVPPSTPLAASDLFPGLGRSGSVRTRHSEAY